MAGLASEYFRRIRIANRKFPIGSSSDHKEKE